MRAVLKNIPIFKGLNEAERSLIFNNGILKNYRKGEIVFKKGESGSILYVVIKGEIKISLFRDDKEIILKYFREGEFFGELPLFTLGKRTATAIACKNSTLFMLDHRVFLTVLKKSPEILLKITREMAKRIEESNKKIFSLAFLDTAGKIARYLYDLSREKGEEIGEWILIKDRPQISEIAKNLGISRETASRVINTWRKAGMIELKRKEIFINREFLSEV